MTQPRSWTARPERRRIRRRHATTRSTLIVVLGLLATTTIAAAVTAPWQPRTAPVPNEDVASPAATTAASAPTPPDPSTSPVRVRPVPDPPDVSASPAAAPTTRVPTRDDPLRVWIAGDSMWEAAGPVVAARLEATGVVATWLDVHYSSGLTRPDFFDWPDRTARTLQDTDPELVLVLLGANDAQTITADGVRHAYGTAGFTRAYEHRTRQLMELLTTGGRPVVWVGLPVMRPDGYDARMQTLTDIHRDVAATAPGVIFVPTRALFSDADGTYADVLSDAGQPQRLRGADGIHLTRAGAERLATHLLDVIQQTWHLPTSPSEGSP